MTPLLILGDEDSVGCRLDQFLAGRFPDFSRSEIQVAIRGQKIQVNGRCVLPKYRLKQDDQLTVLLEKETCLIDEAEDIPLRIIYEDEALIVINKPAGLTVHPGAGQKQGTLLNALLFHLPSLSLLPRAGIVHRLDKDTAGLMVVAKTPEVRISLIEALKKHEVVRRYVALVWGQVQNQTINAPIGRHRVDRIKMAVLLNSAQAKPAITHISVLQHFERCSLIQASLETGRTHQIRVHLAHLGHPLLGDRVYGRKGMQNEALSFHRQALQAEYLSFLHPQTQEAVSFQVPWEADFLGLLEGLKNSNAILKVGSSPCLIK